jgi:hypothetical protein
MVDKMKLFKIGITAWGSLGFYRGVQSYNYNYNYNYTVAYNKRNPEHYYYRYSDCIYNGGIALRTSYPTTTTTTSTTSTTTTTTSTTSTSTTTTTTTTAAPTTTTTTVVGFIQLINFGGFGSSIVSVEPSFFILTSGGLPVTSGMTSSGTQSGYTGNLGVTVSGASGLNLQLYVNSSLINSLPVTSDGIYTFVGVSIPNNVSVIIQLVNPA